MQQLDCVTCVKYLVYLAEHSLSLGLEDFERLGGVVGHVLQLRVCQYL
jgi:hypothetical protein